jgi:hypothetical protein
VNAFGPEEKHLSRIREKWQYIKLVSYLAFVCGSFQACFNCRFENEA